MYFKLSLMKEWAILNLAGYGGWFLDFAKFKKEANGIAEKGKPSEIQKRNDTSMHEPWRNIKTGGSGLVENKLLGKIEFLRNELNLLAKELGIRSPEVVKKSAELDKALNEYEHWKRTKRIIRHSGIK